MSDILIGGFIGFGSALAVMLVQQWLSNIKERMFKLHIPYIIGINGGDVLASFTQYSVDIERELVDILINNVMYASKKDQKKILFLNKYFQLFLECGDGNVDEHICNIIDNNWYEINKNIISEYERFCKLLFYPSIVRAYISIDSTRPQK